MKKLFLSPVVIGSFVLSLFIFGCGSSEEKKQNDAVAPDTSKGVSAMSHDSLSTDPGAVVYVCPCGGCPDVKESKPGKCPKCDMDLVENKK